jgi:hypothetical protein
MAQPPNLLHYGDNLRGTVEREGAAIGVFLSIKAPTKPMHKEAADAGFYTSPAGARHPWLQILPELERRLRAEAARLGLEPQAYVLRAVQERLGAAGGGDEAELLRQNNAGLPAETWRRYHELVAKRRAESLSAAEQQESIGLSDRIEQANAERMRHLLDLARRRGARLKGLVNAFGVAATLTAR